jgi:hypothetical protein
MQWDNLEHHVPDGGLLVAAAFCWTNAAWSGQDHQLHGARQAFFIRVSNCLLEDGHILWDVSSNKELFGAPEHQVLAASVPR